MVDLPIVKEFEGKTLILNDMTENPIRVMSMAWEVMLGQPDLVLDGYKVLQAPIDEILKARHKTVMEYVGLSLRLMNFRIEYLATMASCRAGFSVNFVPTGKVGETIADVGCTLLSLFTWMESGFSAMPLDHYPFRHLLMMVMEEASPELFTILETHRKGVERA